MQRNPQYKPKMKRIKKPTRKHTKGQQNEHLVSQHLKRKGWNIVCQNYQFFGVEVDILAKKKGIYTLVEVKSLRNEAHLEKILSDQQKTRLKTVAEALSPQTPKGLHLLLALVNLKGTIHFVEIE
ncbi:MAG: YraN family protein [Bdellovibrionales bacterium]|nr:YraN family protein [Bdellovibrionales bacterium]